MFLPFAPIFVGMHILVATTGDVPRVEIEKTCRASEKAIKDVFGNSVMGDIFENCMAQEKNNLALQANEWVILVLF